jgi:hypothetical protein
VIEKLRANFRGGLDKIKWLSAVLSERLKIEIAVIKLLSRADGMEKKKGQLLEAIGRRVYELKGNTDKNILGDREVRSAIDEIEKIEQDLEELRQRASEIGSVGA